MVTVISLCGNCDVLNDGVWFFTTSKVPTKRVEKQVQGCMAFTFHVLKDMKNIAMECDPHGYSNSFK